MGVYQPHIRNQLLELLNPERNPLLKRQLQRQKFIQQMKENGTSIPEDEFTRNRMFLDLQNQLDQTLYVTRQTEGVPRRYNVSMRYPIPASITKEFTANSVSIVKDKAMIKKTSAAVCILFASLSGCAKDRRLSLPPNSEQVNITVKVPKDLKARTLEVMYRSPVCKRITSGASGQRIELEGYNGIDVQLQRQGQSDLYEAKIPMDGGGECQWRLSSVFFGVVYGNPTHYGSNVTWGAGGGVVVKFDQNRALRGTGFFRKVEGDLIIKKDYYPQIDEDFLGAYKKTISLVGEGNIYLGYQALQARRVYFEPVLHSDFVVYTAGPKVKKKGNYTTVTYPDGSVDIDGRSGPNFLKLQAIRMAAEAKK